MLWILKRYAWKPILTIMHERTEKIEKTLDDANQKNLNADKRLEDYQKKIEQIEDEGRLIIQNSIRKAQKAAQELNFEAEAKTSEMIKKAQDDIAREHIQAKKMLKSEVTDLVFLTFEKLTKLKLTHEERDQLEMQLMDEGL